MTKKTENTSDNSPVKKSVWSWLGSINGKLTLVIALLSGLNFFMPVIRKAIIGEDIENLEQVCRKYTDEQIESKQSEAETYLDIIMEDIVKIKGEITYLKNYVKNDSLSKKNIRWFPVGLFADKNGVMHYRNNLQGQYPVRPNYTKQKYEYKDHDGDWVPCYFEKQ